MGKLTPTHSDKVKESGNGAALHVVAAHEPTKSEIPPYMNWPPAVDAAPLLTGPTKLPFDIHEAQVATEPPVVPAKPLKIALIGTAPSSRMLAPFNDPSWTIWACSPGNMNILPRVDVWFELHGNLHWPENQSYGAPYIDWLRRLTIPVMMQNNQYIPNAVIFPMEQMVNEFGKDFFTSSFAWMMAKAISDGANEIALFGIDMASRDEYILQRPGFYFFKHLAEKRGIKVSAPNESDIMQPPGLYGYSDVTPFGRKLLARTTELKSRLDQMRGERDKLSHNITYLEGAIEDLDYVSSIWMGVGSPNSPPTGGQNG
jgi:hypothetical protein